MSENKDADAGEQRTFEDKVQGAQDRIEAAFRRLGMGSWARSLRMARKPSRQEF